MAAPLPSLPVRIWIALSCFFRALVDARFAALVDEARTGGALPPGAPAQAPAGVPAPRPEAQGPSMTPGAVTPLATPALLPVATPAQAAPAPLPRDGALLLLSLLQREGRLLDFCEEELVGFNDATIGAAARLVHDGCRKALRAHFTLLPVRSEAEGALVEVEAGFDPRAIRLTGNVVGAPPFKGALRHHGWKVAEVRLPETAPGAAGLLVAPAEVELP